MSARHAQDPSLSLTGHAAAREGPGQKLRVAREAAQLSIGQVAAHLRLDTRTVNALEADRYEVLPAPIFVRGYLRSYARLLDLPPEPLVEAFDQRGIEPPSLIADIAEPSQTRTSDLAVRLGTYTIIIGLAVLVGLWWQSREPKPLSSLLGTTGTVTQAPAVERGVTHSPLMAPDSSVAPTSTAAEAPVAPAPDEPLRTVPPPTRPPTATAQPTAPAPGAEGRPGSGTPPPDSATTPAEAAPKPGISVAVETAPVTAIADSAAAPPATAPRTPPEEPAPPASDATPAPREDRLSLKLAHESWIEVYDRDGGRLYYDLAKAGSELELSGKSPFKVLFGYAGSTSVWFNGVAFDPAPFAVRGIARFVLGGPATPSGPQDLVASAPPARE